MAEAGLHDVRHQRLDLDDVAAFRLFRDVDQHRAHQITSSVQAASVTTTSALADQNEPSDSLAIATIFCESARRMRVETCARPARAPSTKLATFGCGFFSTNTWMLLTRSSGLVGLATLTVSGTVLPFSTSGGTSSLTLPVRTTAVPVISRIADAIAAGVASAGRNATVATTAPPDRARKSRRECLVSRMFLSIAAA